VGLRLLNAAEFNKDPKWHLDEAARLVDEAIRLMSEGGADVQGYGGPQTLQKATEAAKLIRESAGQLGT
jgi:hypothetical protein